MQSDRVSSLQEDSMPGPISVLVIDDHPVLRYGISRLLEDEPDFLVAGVAGNCEEASRIADECHPDVLLLDLDMGNEEDAYAKCRLTGKGSARVIIYTAHTDDERVLEAVQIGINGYVTKEAPKRRLCEAIRIVARGGMYLDPAVASKVTAWLAGRVRPSKAPELTGREVAVLEAIAAGKRNKEIAGALNISERTVKFHASAIFSKLGATNRTEAVRIAIANRLLAL